jgi:hypothetical protein
VLSFRGWPENPELVATIEARLKREDPRRAPDFDIKKTIALDRNFVRSVQPGQGHHGSIAGTRGPPSRFQMWAGAPSRTQG